eukprot:8521192-Alexandrium_andersonii.AAC.1
MFSLSADGAGPCRPFPHKVAGSPAPWGALRPLDATPFLSAAEGARVSRSPLGFRSPLGRAVGRVAHLLRVAARCGFAPSRIHFG